jgi:PAS domain S-box-containing protein
MGRFCCGTKARGACMATKPTRSSGEPVPTSCTHPKTWLPVCRNRFDRLRFATVSGKATSGESATTASDSRARVVLTRRSNALGQVIGFLQISRDISEEVRLAEQLATTQLYTRSLFESNIDALVTTDPRGIISDANQQMETLTAHTRAELIGSPFKQYFADPTRAEAGIQMVLRDGRLTNYELTIQNKDLDDICVSCNASIFRDASQRVRGVFAAVRDVTERMHFEQTLRDKNVELESANLAKDRFLASMSHELRTPLNAIMGFTGTLLMQLPGPLTDEQDRQLKIVQTSARHLLSLINDLLDVAKIASGTVEIAPERVSAQAVVEEIAVALRPQAEAKGLSLDVVVPKTDIALLTDRRALSQILFNLVTNAIKFTDAGRVRLELTHAAANGNPVIEFQVVDTGVGILPEDQAKLFKAFSQVSVAPPRRQQGTGLGLHLSGQLARLIGGQIACRSEYGKGSTFTLALPAD